jgi:hypothetical protein
VLDKLRNSLLFALLGASSVIAGHSQVLSGNAPRLEKRGIATQLIVDGKPFLVLGGELRNSSPLKRRTYEGRLATLYSNAHEYRVAAHRLGDD